MNTGRLLLVLAALLGFIGGLRWDAVKVHAIRAEFMTYKLQVAELVTAQKQAALDDRTANEAALQQQEETHGKAIQDIQGRADRLADRLRAERVHVCADSAGNLPTHSPATGGGNDAVAHDPFSGTAGIDLVRLARDADQAVNALGQCQAYIRVIQGQS